MYKEKEKLMKFLNPQIEALAKEKPEKNLVRQSASCGIFQDYENNSQNSTAIYPSKTEKANR